MKYGEKESKLFENAILKRNKAVLRKEEIYKIMAKDMGYKGDTAILFIADLNKTEEGREKLLDWERMNYELVMEKKKLSRTIMNTNRTMDNCKYYFWSANPNSTEKYRKAIALLEH